MEIEVEPVEQTTPITLDMKEWESKLQMAEASIPSNVQQFCNVCNPLKKWLKRWIHEVEASNWCEERSINQHFTRSYGSSPITLDQGIRILPSSLEEP